MEQQQRGAAARSVSVVLFFLSAIAVAAFVFLAGAFVQECVHATGHVYDGHTVLIDAFGFFSPLPAALALLSLAYVFALSRCPSRKEPAALHRRARALYWVWLAFSATYLTALTWFWFFDPGARVIKPDTGAVLQGLSWRLGLVWVAGSLLGYASVRIRSGFLNGLFVAVPLVATTCLTRSLLGYGVWNTDIPSELRSWESVWWVWLPIAGAALVTGILLDRRNTNVSRQGSATAAAFQTGGFAGLALVNRLAYVGALPMHHLCTSPDHPREAWIITGACMALGVVLLPVFWVLLKERAVGVG